MKTKLFRAVWVTLGFAGLVVSYETTVPDNVKYQVSRVPDRVILTWAGDPATTQAVTWRTDTSVTSPVAEIAESEDGPNYPKKAKAVPAVSETLKNDAGEALYHSVRFTELKPSTVYAYRVGDGSNWSEWNQFRTASDKPEPLEFVYVGDAQNDIFSMWSRLIRQAYSDAPKLRFIVHAGDLINRNTIDSEWGQWHQAAGWINRSVPSFPTPGNHEYGGKKLDGNWRPQFTLPDNGVPGLEETNYYLDVQGVRIVALNSNEKRAEQAEWLDKLLANNPNKWTILTFHHPILSTAKGRDNKELREMWQPIIDKYKVDIVLTGHDHTYGRSNVMSGANAQSDAGTVYVVSVSGPKMYKLEPQPWMKKSAEQTQLFQVIRINRDRMHYESRTARGVLYDSFDLVKRKGKRNQIVEGKL